MNNEIILIISDTHGNLSSLKTVAEKVRPDRVLHLGDAEGQDDEIVRLCGCPLSIVRGNCDWGSALPEKLILEIGTHRVLMVHGHRQQVKYDDFALVLAAKNDLCDTVLYGHTHMPEAVIREGITIINPGSLSLPRQAGRRPSYAVCDVDAYGDLHFAINYL